MTKKITRSTIKSFIKNNFDNLYIATLSRFNGMIDCVDQCNDQTFNKVELDKRERFNDSSLTIKNAYFVKGRDYFTKFNKNGFVGYEIWNCVGCFILAIKESNND